MSCTSVLKEELSLYVTSVKNRLFCPRSRSKQCWSLSKKLLLGVDGNVSIPALKQDDGTWIRAPRDKANRFPDTFREK